MSVSQDKVLRRVLIALNSLSIYPHHLITHFAGVYLDTRDCGRALSEWAPAAVLSLTSTAACLVTQYAQC